MSSSTTNLSLLKKNPATDGSDTFNIQTMLNDNWDKIDSAVAAKETSAGAQAKVDVLAGVGNTKTVKQLDVEAAVHLEDIAYQAAGGTATAITLTTATLTDGYAKTFIASANNNGVVTTINSKPLYKPNTVITPTLVSGKAYTVWYSTSGDCFFVRASAEGTATTAQVLAGVPFSNETDTGLLGTMPNKVGSNEVYTVSIADQIITQGYRGGAAADGKIKGEANLLASNIKSGVVIGPVTGIYNPVSGNVMDTSTPSAPTAAQLLTSKVAFANGVSITGTMPNNSALGTYTPGPNSQSIPAGYTSGGTVAAVTFTAAKLLTGTTVAGTAGTMADKTASATVITPSNSDQAIPVGFYPGGTGDGKVAAVVVPAANVLTGTTIAGTAGTMPNRGTVTLTPAATSVVIPQGYHSGAGTVSAVAVTSSHLLTGDTVAGTAGTMINKTSSATVVTPSGADQAIPQGYYPGAAGDGKVAAVVVPAANVLTGTTIAGTSGSMTNQGAAILIPTAAGVPIPAGYHNGSGYVAASASFIAANILSTATIWNVTGTAVNGAAMKRFASGTATSNSSGVFTVSGLAFTPNFAFSWNTAGNGIVGGLLIRAGVMTWASVLYNCQTAGVQYNMTMTSSGFDMHNNANSVQTYNWMAFD